MGFSHFLMLLTFLVVFLQILEFGQSVLVLETQLLEENSHVSILGDPGMKSPDSRFGFEAWNFCNEVGMEAPKMGSPRMADCADLHCPNSTDESRSSRADEKGKCEAHQRVKESDKRLKAGDKFPIDEPGSSRVDEKGKCEAHHRVKESDNRLKAGDKFPIGKFKPYTDPDTYAVEKELYLGSLCESPPRSTEPWYFWMIMLKNGNFDKNTTLCPENGKKVPKIVTDRSFPCFGKGCMNQPLVFHNQSKMVSSVDGRVSLVGGYYGTYNLDADLSAGARDVSFFSASWRKNLSTNSWIVSQKLTTSSKYPWLMLYLRSDASKGFNGGYHYDGRGIMKKLPESPNFKVRLTLDIKQGGGANSQFYLTDIGSCWKNDGEPCDGDVLTDVTRYSEMIINPATTSWCRPDNLVSCPPYHISPTGERIYRNDTSRFPYSAYHLYCAPGNARYLEKPYDICDPYSNPQAQELVQILPHPEWAVHGYPRLKGEGWIGDRRTWELDTGALSSRLYFYQDPGTKPAKRVWTSINVGTEIYVSPSGATAEWTVSDFDVLVSNNAEKDRKDYV